MLTNACPLVQALRSEALQCDMLQSNFWLEPCVSCLLQDSEAEAEEQNPEAEDTTSKPAITGIKL